ncbi:MAG: GDSL-type esterase/lipase family protein [Kiritimatiellia bacterium]
MIQKRNLWTHAITAACCIVFSSYGPGAEAAANPGAFPLKDGDTWVMVGDSITAQHLHSNYIEAFCYARFPQWTFRFRNSGVGGDNVARALARFDGDVAPWKPTVVSVELGMNGEMGGAAGFITNMTILAERIRAVGARPVYLTSSPVNSGQGPTAGPHGLATFASNLNAFATEQKAPFADQYNILVGLWASNKPIENLHRLAGDIQKTVEIQKDVPGRDLLAQWTNIWAGSEMQSRGASLGGDPVHPGPVGQLTMCAVMLQELKAPGLVSSATLDSSGKVVEQVQCRVSNASAENNGKLSFDRQDDCLPMPIPDEARGALIVYPSIADLSRWLLKITGLKPGSYRVEIDGTPVATVSADELDKGWNMGTLAKGPVADQCREIMKLVAEKENLVSRWRGRSKEIAMAKTPDKELQASLDEIMKQILEADAKIREAARPKSRHFTVTPAE